MLAYVFWHWPTPETDRETYENHLRAFHRALAAGNPDGFLRSAVFRLRGVPWLETDADAYEDWYLVESSAALDVINDAAVTAARKDPHDRAARHAAGGAAGLYRLREGSENLEATRFAYWLAKPAGVSYPDFYAQLRPLTDQPDVGLWGRQMVLGPTPEFTLRSPRPLDLPASLVAHKFELERILPTT
jgi:hypothetical protein